MSIWGNYIKISSNIKLFINSNNKKYLQAFHHRISPELAQSFSLWIFFLLALISASNLPLQSCSKFLLLLVTPLPTRLRVPAGISGLPGGSPTGAGESRANLGGKFLVKIHYITWTLMMVAEATSHQTWTWTWCSGKNSRLRFFSCWDFPMPNLGLWRGEKQVSAIPNRIRWGQFGMVQWIISH